MCVAYDCAFAGAEIRAVVPEGDDAKAGGREVGAAELREPVERRRRPRLWVRVTETRRAGDEEVVQRRRALVVPEDERRHVDERGVHGPRNGDAPAARVGPFERNEPFVFLQVVAVAHEDSDVELVLERRRGRLGGRRRPARRSAEDGEVHRPIGGEDGDAVRRGGLHARPLARPPAEIRAVRREEPEEALEQRVLRGVRRVEPDHHRLRRYRVVAEVVGDGRLEPGDEPVGRERGVVVELVLVDVEARRERVRAEVGEDREVVRRRRQRGRERGGRYDPPLHPRDRRREVERVGQVVVVDDDARDLGGVLRHQRERGRDRRGPRVQLREPELLGGAVVGDPDARLLPVDEPLEGDGERAHVGGEARLVDDVEAGGRGSEGGKCLARRPREPGDRWGALRVGVYRGWRVGGRAGVADLACVARLWSVRGVARHVRDGIGCGARRRIFLLPCVVVGRCDGSARVARHVALPSSRAPGGRARERKRERRGGDETSCERPCFVHLPCLFAAGAIDHGFARGRRENAARPKHEAKRGYAAVLRSLPLSRSRLARIRSLEQRTRTRARRHGSWKESPTWPKSREEGGLSPPRSSPRSASRAAPLATRCPPTPASVRPPVRLPAAARRRAAGSRAAARGQEEARPRGQAPARAVSGADRDPAPAPRPDRGARAAARARGRSTAALRPTSTHRFPPASPARGPAPRSTV